MKLLSKYAGKKKAELAPEIIALEAKRQAAITSATEAAKAKFDVAKPLTATEAGGMRSQFLAQSKDFADTVRAYQRVSDSASAGNSSAKGLGMASSPGSISAQTSRPTFVSGTYPPPWKYGTGSAIGAGGGRAERSHG